ncbi:Prok-JAB domain-containing protein [Gammaproteobacteria bacterium]
MLRQLSNDHWAWQISPQIRGSLPVGFIQALSRWCQRELFAREAGGIVLGFIDIETGGLLAETITTPVWGDKRSRTGFYRGVRHQVKAEDWNRNTGGRGTMLGLWHTHPEPIPHPSGTGWNDLANVLDQGAYSSPGLIYLIVGTSCIGCWFGERVVFQTWILR